jgi:putative oxidoreductase
VDLGKVALRGTVGPLLIGHGTQKLFGWFGGAGPDATGGFFEKLGLKPGKRHAVAAGVSETAGGVLLTLGALTPVAAGLISGTMITAIRKVHADKGPWVTEGGYEYPLALIAASMTLTETGPGKPSVDDSLMPWFKGSGFALLVLAGAAAGSYLVTEKFNEAAGEEPAAAPSDAATGEQEPPRRFSRDAAETSAPAA